MNPFLIFLCFFSWIAISRWYIVYILRANGIHTSYLFNPFDNDYLSLYKLIIKTKGKKKLSYILLGIFSISGYITMILLSLNHLI